MQKIAIILALCCLRQIGMAQLYNNGSVLQVNTGCIVQVNGNFTNTATSTHTNNGIINVTGNCTNNQVMASPNNGTLAFTGTTAQTINGSATYFTKDVLLNNAAGLTLNTTLKIDGVATLTNGSIVAAIATPIIFTTNGTVSGANDNSHVNGYVVKEGNGSFMYPVGDGSKYQPCNVNLSANALGMQVKYNATNAGAGAFTTNGTEATALIAYNALENWEITPISIATGTVTMFWDNYKNVGILNVSDLKVAHKISGNWLNEGTTGIGTVATGSVTSNVISTWDIFTLGSRLNSTLPLRWVNVNGSLNAQKQAIINWQVQEQSVANYIVEKSNDGRIFNNIATLGSKGNGTNNYSFTEAQTLSNIAYYRLKQVDVDGKFSYSSIIKLLNNEISTLSVYPNPAITMFTLSVDRTLLNTNATLIDIKGTNVQQIKITQLQQQVNIASLAQGTYLLKTANGATQKIIKL